jgi:hypothetical protein
MRRIVSFGKKCFLKIAEQVNQEQGESGAVGRSRSSGQGQEQEQEQE